MRASALLLLGGVACGLWLGTPASVRADDSQARLAALDPKYRAWLEDVDLLIGKDERRQFLELTKDYQRDGFIHRFWEARNPVPGSTRNPWKAQWEARLAAVRSAYGNITEDRARMRLLHGEPADVLETDCGMALWPLELWHYAGGERMPRNIYLVFYSHGGGYRLWRHADGLGVLIARLSSIDPVDLGAPARGGGGPKLGPDQNPELFEIWARDNCGGMARNVINAIEGTDRLDLGTLLDQLFVPPPPRDAEWLASFRGLATDLPAGAAALPARLSIAFPARDRGRTVVAGLVQVAASDAAAAELGGQKAYNFLLTGEVLHDAELAESFRYRFDLPAAGLGDTLPLAFERTLPAGDYVLVLRVEDLHSRRNFRAEQPLTVPPAAGLPEAAAVGVAREQPPVGAAIEAARAELRAGAEPAAGGPSAAAAAAAAAVRLVPPPGKAQTGAVRLEAEASGEGIRRLTFFLDGKAMLSRVRPPYTVELNLGPVPETREVRAAAYDAAGRELARDLLVLNPPQQRFAVRLVEPRMGSRHRGEVLVRAELHVPDGASLDRLELFRDDQRVATLYQPPFVQRIPLPAAAGGAGAAGGARGAQGASFVRAVAYLAGGGTAEDLAVINSQDVVEKLDVRLVEMSAAVFDRAGRPVAKLAAGDFEILDGGERQTVLRCERVRDLPLHLLFAIDTSASMAQSLPRVQQAALAFLQRVLTARDRAALLTFSDSPVLRLPFTDDLRMLGGALAGLNAERGTALFDGLVYGLSYMRGMQHGQSALILFTDGGDHVSRLRFDEALEFARRAGIPIYAIGARIPRLELTDRGRLAKLAEATGGRSFFVESAAELEGVYGQIEDELRSRYLLAYQPNAAPRAGEFRPVEVRVAGAGLRVKTAGGYYP
ncbi:MAG TPA: VWA domain-containing protein [Thermoanaerobaculia bacterium]|nr:VWA domain-containing protein [Thermoanaerobaculia bacterium]